MKQIFSNFAIWFFSSIILGVLVFFFIAIKYPEYILETQNYILKCFAFSALATFIAMVLHHVFEEIFKQ